MSTPSIIADGIWHEYQQVSKLKKLSAPPNPEEGFECKPMEYRDKSEPIDEFEIKAKTNESIWKWNLKRKSHMGEYIMHG